MWQWNSANRSDTEVLWVHLTMWIGASVSEPKPHVLISGEQLTSTGEQCVLIDCMSASFLLLPSLCHVLGATLSGGAPTLPQLSEGSDTSSSEAEMHVEWMDMHAETLSVGVLSCMSLYYCLMPHKLWTSAEGLANEIMHCNIQLSYCLIIHTYVYHTDNTYIAEEWMANVRNGACNVGTITSLNKRLECDCCTRALCMCVLMHMPSCTHCRGIQCAAGKIIVNNWYCFIIARNQFAFTTECNSQPLRHYIIYNMLTVVLCSLHKLLCNEDYDKYMKIMWRPSNTLCTYNVVLANHALLQGLIYTYMYVYVIE